MKAYLLPRMLFLDPIAMQAAMYRGRADDDESGNEFSSGICTREKGFQDAFRCLEERPVFKRVKQCSTLDFLPF